MWTTEKQSVLLSAALSLSAGFAVWRFWALQNRRKHSTQDEKGRPSSPLSPSHWRTVKHATLLVRHSGTQAWRESHADPKVVASENVVLVMVGLPARGKSYLSGAVVRHLTTLGVRAQTFNCGKLRRDEGQAGASASFFSAENTEAKAFRERLAMQCCDMMFEWLSAAPAATSSVAILDATNTTTARRHAVVQKCRAAHQASGGKTPLRVIFFESICDDPQILGANYDMKKKNDDYKSATDTVAAAEDFRKRVQAYEEQYEPLDDAELDAIDDEADHATEDAALRHIPIGSIRTINGGQKLVCCRTGRSLVAAPVIELLHAMHLTPRRIILVKEVTSSAQQLCALLQQAEQSEGQPVDVMFGASRRAILLAEALELRMAPHTAQLANPRAILTLRSLSALGVVDEVKSEGLDSVGGESVKDLVFRMREVMLLIERLPRSVLVVCPGKFPIRILMAHFKGLEEGVSIADAPDPKGPVTEMRRDHKGFSVKDSDWPQV